MFNTNFTKKVRSRCEKIVQIDVKAPNLAWLMFRSNYFIWAWDPPQNICFVYFTDQIWSHSGKNIFFFKVGLIIYHSKALLKFFKMKLRISMRKCFEKIRKKWKWEIAKKKNWFFEKMKIFFPDWDQIWSVKYTKQMFWGGSQAQMK